KIWTLAAAEETEVRVGRAAAHHGVQRRAADEFDDRRRRPAAEEEVLTAAPIGRRRHHVNRRENDPMGRVEVAYAVLRLEVVVVLRRRRARLIDVVLAELVVLRPAERVAQTAAPALLARPLVERDRGGVVLPLAAGRGLVHQDVAELGERPQQLSLRDRRVR